MQNVTVDVGVSAAQPLLMRLYWTGVNPRHAALYSVIYIRTG